MKNFYYLVVFFLCLFYASSFSQPVFEPFVNQSKPFDLTGIESVKIQINDENNCLTPITRAELVNQLANTCKKYGLKVLNNEARAAVQIYIRYTPGNIFELPNLVLRLDVIEKVKSFRTEKPIEAITYSINMLAECKTKDLQKFIEAQYIDFHFQHFIGSWLATNSPDR